MLFLTALLLVAQPNEATIGMKSDPKAVRQMQVVGQCIAKQHAKTARKVLALDYRTKSYGEALRQLGLLGGLCAREELGRSNLRSGGLLFAGSVAEGLMAQDGVLGDFGARTGYRPEIATIEARDGGEYLALCVVRTNPGATAAMLRADPATVEEYHALKALGPSLSACVPANSKSQFTREALRALLALGAYRLAGHNQQATD